MRNPTSIDCHYLYDLAEKIQMLPPDEASALLFEGSAIILFAGFPKIAYQGFLKLIQGELKISEASSLANPLKTILHVLCYSMEIPCPGIFSEQEMSLRELEEYIYKLHQYKRISCLERLFNVIIPSGSWSEYVVNAWKNRYIQKWWQSSDNLISNLLFVASFPDVLKRISEGILRDELNISQEQAQEFLESVSKRNYNPESIKFVPTVEDWKNFLAKWNQRIFENLDEGHIDNYKFRYADVLASKCCFRKGATEEEVAELEKKLQAKFPLSYKNFLLASNGFVILNEYCELYGTNQIKWFIDENRDGAEVWDNDDDIDDEKYFQYGEHQDCIWIRYRYLKTALQISSTEDGYIYLLNPQIMDSRNEWEAWDLGSKLPGAYRYRSFWEMMQEVYQRSFGS